MCDYDDFTINLPDSGNTAVGVCHARGSNSKLLAAMVNYIGTCNTTASAEQCLKQGGEVLHRPRKMGDNDLCVIKDPAGAMLALVSD